MEFILRRIDQARGQAALNRGHAPRPRIVGQGEGIQVDAYDMMAFGAKLALRSARSVVDIPRKAGKLVVDKANELMHVSAEDLRDGHREHELKIARETAAKAIIVDQELDNDLEKMEAQTEEPDSDALYEKIAAQAEEPDSIPGLDALYEKLQDARHAPDLVALDKKLQDARHMPRMLEHAVTGVLELAGAERTDRDPEQTSDLRRELIGEAPAREHGVLAGTILNQYLPHGVDVAALPVDLGTISPVVVETAPQLRAADEQPRIPDQRQPPARPTPPPPTPREPSPYSLSQFTGH